MTNTFGKLTIHISGPRASGKSALAHIIKKLLEKHANYTVDYIEEKNIPTYQAERIRQSYEKLKVKDIALKPRSLIIKVENPSD